MSHPIAISFIRECNLKVLDFCGDAYQPFYPSSSCHIFSFHNMAEYDLLAEYGIAIPNGSTPFESRLRSDACRVVHTIIRPPAPSSKSSAQVLKLAARPPPVPVVQHIEPKKTRWKKSVLPLHIQKAKSMIMKSLLQPDLVTSPTAAKKASSLLKRQPEPMTLHRNDPSRETLHHVRSCSGGISSNVSLIF